MRHRDKTAIQNVGRAVILSYLLLHVWKKLTRERCATGHRSQPPRMRPLGRRERGLFAFRGHFLNTLSEFPALAVSGMQEKVGEIIIGEPRETIIPLESLAGESDGDGSQQG